MNIEKNKLYEVEIIDNGANGEGIAKIDGFTVFVDNSLKGERCKILIVKVNKNFAYGKIMEIMEKSKYRIEPDCDTYKRCGGCNLRHINYDYTLKMKQAMVQNLANKSLNEKIEVKQTIGMENPFYYRNKLQYPIGLNKNGKNVMGVFANRTHDIIETDNCKIQNKEAQKVANEFIDILNEKDIVSYDEKKRKGSIRHIIVKIGINTNEIMCILVTNEEKIKDEEYIVERLIKKFPNIKSIIKNINSNNTNVILGEKNVLLYGNEYIKDRLGNFVFKISSKSFYQTNPIQTEILYKKAIEGAKLNKEDILCDLYCGIGTIGIYASSFVSKVYGIEIVEQAIEDAKENAMINNIENIKFKCGAVENILEDLIKEENIAPNIVFVDPPRRGLDKNTIDNILKLRPEKVIYISCNPATMVRDINMMEGEYQIKEIQPVDMFPYTSHVECIAVLKV